MNYQYTPQLYQLPAQFRGRHQVLSGVEDSGKWIKIAAIGVIGVVVYNMLSSKRR